MICITEMELWSVVMERWSSLSAARHSPHLPEALLQLGV